MPWIRHAGWGRRCGAGPRPAFPCPHSNLPLLSLSCLSPSCLSPPCPTPASSCLSLPLSLYCPGPILLCPQLYPACPLLSVPILSSVFSCLAPPCLWPFHLALLLACPCPHPACARLDWILCSSCLLLSCHALTLPASILSLHTQNTAPGWSGRCCVWGHPASFWGRVSSLGSLY